MTHQLSSNGRMILTHVRILPRIRHPVKELGGLPFLNDQFVPLIHHRSPIIQGGDHDLSVMIRLSGQDGGWRPTSPAGVDRAGGRGY